MLAGEQRRCHHRDEKGPARRTGPRRWKLRTGVSVTGSRYNDFPDDEYPGLLPRDLGGLSHTPDSCSPPEVTALYGDPNNPTVPKYTYIAPGVTVFTRDRFGRPDSIDKLAYISQRLDHARERRYGLVEGGVRQRTGERRQLVGLRRRVGQFL